MVRSSTRLALLLLDQYCGTLVHETANCLFKHGPCALKFIAFITKQKISIVRSSLSLLLQHRFCNINLNDKGIFQYELSLKKVLGILNYQNYPLIASSVDYDELYSNFIITTLLQEGQMTIKTLVSTFQLNFPNGPLNQLEDVFSKLFNRKFIHCSQAASIEDRIALDNPATNDPATYYGLFHIKKSFEAITTNEKSDEPAAKRTRSDGDFEDSVYWCLNHTQFDLELQYKLVFNGLKSYFADETVASVAKAVIDLSILDTNICNDRSVPVPFQNILRTCRLLSREKVSECLELMEDDCVPLIRSADILASGGTYVVETKKVLKKMLGDTFALMVGQKLSSFHARIFRIIRDKGSLPQKLIEEIAMVTPKECKEYVFDLVKAGFIKTNYYSRVQDYVPAKTYFVFTVDLDQVAKRTLEESCHAIYNAMTRRLHEIEQNKQLIDRKKYVDFQIEALSKEENSEQQIEDLRSSFTTHDLEVIQKAEDSIRKLEMAELHVTNTLTLMMSWLNMQKISI